MQWMKLLWLRHAWGLGNTLIFVFVIKDLRGAGWIEKVTQQFLPVENLGANQEIITYPV